MYDILTHLKQCLLNIEDIIVNRGDIEQFNDNLYLYQSWVIQIPDGAFDVKKAFNKLEDWKKKMWETYKLGNQNMRELFENAAKSEDFVQGLQHFNMDANTVNTRLNEDMLKIWKEIWEYCAELNVKLEENAEKIGLYGK